MLEFLRVEHSKDIAQMIVSRRTITKRKKPPQQSELLFAEARYIGDCLSSSQDREQAQQEHFVQRVLNFPLLPGIVQMLEII